MIYFILLMRCLIRSLFRLIRLDLQMTHIQPITKAPSLIPEEEALLAAAETEKNRAERAQKAAE